MPAFAKRARGRPPSSDRWVTCRRRTETVVAVDSRLTVAGGRSEAKAADEMVTDIPGKHRVPIGS